MRVQSLDWEDPLEEGMTTHFSILGWRIPWTEEPGGESHGQKNLASYSPQGRRESDMTEASQHPCTYLDLRYNAIPHSPKEGFILTMVPWSLLFLLLRTAHVCFIPRLQNISPIGVGTWSVLFFDISTALNKPDSEQAFNEHTPYKRIKSKFFSSTSYLWLMKHKKLSVFHLD